MNVRIKQPTQILPVLVAAAWLPWASPVSAEVCADPCQVPTTSVPELQLLDTTSGATDWEIETLSDGGTLQIGSTVGDEPFRIEDGADTNLLVLDSADRIGIKTNTPGFDLEIDDTRPEIRLDDTSASAGQVNFQMETNLLSIEGNGQQDIIRMDTRSLANVLNINQVGDVGINTTGPTQEFHVNDSANDADLNGSFRISTPSHAWDFATIDNNGVFRISKFGTGTSEFNVAPNGNLNITGTLTTGGPTCGGGCDLVFSDEFELDSIDEHAAAMWSKRHLPAVGPTPENEPFNLTKKVGGMLHELEKAHIYIAQLNDELAAKDTQIATLAERLAALERRLEEQPQ